MPTTSNTRPRSGSGPPRRSAWTAQRELHEEGRITLDRYLDAVSQYAAAVAQEAQFKTTYNNSIVALEEAKGTLLEYDKITVVEHPGANNPGNLKPDGAAKATSLEAPSPSRASTVASMPHAPTAKADEAKATTPNVDAAGRTISFQMTINIGSRPVEIKGSFTVSLAGSRDGASLGCAVSGGFGSKMPSARPISMVFCSENGHGSL